MTAAGRDRAARLPDRAGSDGLPLLRGRDLLRLVEPELGCRPLLLVSDFDGTLSRIVMDPWGAQILPVARAALRRLTRVPGVHVAFLSGRTATDLASRVRVGGALYVGNHGLERGALARGARSETILVAEDPALAVYVADAKRLAREVPRRVAEPWLIVERKGPAVAFHFRAAPDVAAARGRVLEAAARLDPGRRLVAIPGRRIVEMRPPGAPAKGDALRGLVRDVRPAMTWVLGDDDSDAAAFRALRELREQGLTGGLSVAVHAHPEMPEAVAASADVALAAPEETARFLSRVARLLCAAGAPRGS
ncbi:MAG: trehalose-phosphatase [Candidatus Limnocylindrales bacterium]